MHFHHSPSKRFLRTPRKGLTVTEMLIAMSISLVVATAVFAIFLQALKIYKYEEKKLTINRQIRDFTTELTENATFANYALIYPDFLTRKNIVTVKNPVTGQTTTTGISLQVEDGQSGDMMVLAYVDPDDDTKIQKIIGYYREIIDPEKTDIPAPVRRFEVTFSPSTASPAVDLIPKAETAQQWPEVVELSRGLSDGRLFHNFYGRSVMIKGEIIQGDGRGTRVATNTYNFTISPRG